MKGTDVSGWPDGEHSAEALGPNIQGNALGLTAAVVEDVENAAEHTLARSDTLDWGLSDRQLLDLSRVIGAQADAPAAVTTGMLLEEATVEVMVSNSFYLSSVMMEVLARAPADRGTLVAALSWHHWFSHVITEKTSLRTIALMDELVQKIAASINVTAAESLSADLFWHRPGSGCLRVAFAGEGGRRTIEPPAELAALLS